MEQRKITCIVCPLGCEVTVDIDEGNITDISGYSCKRGKSYAIAEVTAPRRTLTTTMRVQNGAAPVVSVKSGKPVAKDMLFDCMKRINAAAIKAPVKIGDTLIKNVCGTGIDIIATNTVSGV